MQLKIFTVPITNTEPFETEMNNFLATHKVMEVTKEFTQTDNGVYWSFCVEYLQSGVKNKSSKKKKIDYKTVLTEEQFKIFSNLREIRKKIAKEEEVPAYAVFTDEELANISKLDNITLANIKTIEGIGEKKVEKYVGRLIERMDKKSK